MQTTPITTVQTPHNTTEENQDGGNEYPDSAIINDLTDAIAQLLIGGDDSKGTPSSSKKTDEGGEEKKAKATNEKIVEAMLQMLQLGINPSVRIQDLQKELEKLESLLPLTLDQKTTEKLRGIANKMQDNGVEYINLTISLLELCLRAGDPKQLVLSYLDLGNAYLSESKLYSDIEEQKFYCSKAEIMLQNAIIISQAIQTKDRSISEAFLFRAESVFEQGKKIWI
jgi:hypothetical protein